MNMNEIDRLAFIRRNVWLRREMLRLEVEIVKVELCDCDIIPNYYGEIDSLRINYPIGLRVYY